MQATAKLKTHGLGASGLSKTQRHYLQDNGESNDLPQSDSYEIKMCHDIKKKVQPTLIDTLLLLRHGERVKFKNGSLKDYIRDNHKDDLIEITKISNAILSIGEV
jgi:hypothetical protein